MGSLTPQPIPYFANAHTGYQLVTEQFVARISKAKYGKKTRQHYFIPRVTRSEARATNFYLNKYLTPTPNAVEPEFVELYSPKAPER